MNIFIDETWGVQIADFGLAIISDATSNTQTVNGRGTIRWMAPELHFPSAFELQFFTPTYASDVYAFACTCLEVIFTLRYVYDEFLP
jgi:serine/threonine protein kinase